MKLSQDLLWRNLIKDKTFNDVGWLDHPKTFYLGADVGSADSLTIGNLAIFILARRLLDAGWKTVLLVGGATSLIGDPGGKESERELVKKETVEHNKQAIVAQVKCLFAGKEFTLVDNYDWFKDINYLEFLREVGKHYSMTELVQREYISERIGQGGSGISYAEFSYSLIQGYDFWYLAKEYGVILQIGGSDQWGNMLSGVPLIRKKEEIEAHAMSMPLVINKTTGKKFGKSEGGAIWLDENKTSAFEMYQFWLNTGDLDVEDYLKIYTLLPKETIESLLAQHREAQELRLAQKRLAYEVTALVHGKERADSVLRCTEALFGTGNYGDMHEADFLYLTKEIPMLNSKGEKDIVEALVELNMAQSKTEARRFLQDSAVYINGLQFSSDKKTLDHTDAHHGYVVLRRGKNNIALVKIN
jgi:tyrosyl-tRNA synthetase